MSARAGMTPMQAKCLVFIRETIERTGSAPSYREIANAVNLRSKSGVNRLVMGLEERGHVVRIAKRARSIALPEEPMLKCPNCGHAFQVNGT